MLAKKTYNKYRYIIILQETGSTNTFDRGVHLWPGRQVVAQGRECCKFMLWLKHWS